MLWATIERLLNVVVYGTNNNKIQLHNHSLSPWVGHADVGSGAFQERQRALQAALLLWIRHETTHLTAVHLLRWRWRALRWHLLRARRPHVRRRRRWPARSHQLWPHPGRRWTARQVHRRRMLLHRRQRCLVAENRLPVRNLLLILLHDLGNGKTRRLVPL